MTAAAWFALVALAQVEVRVNVPVPQIRFEAPPPLVDVQPGVQVVENFDEEVFASGGWFWVRRDGSWFRTRDVKQPSWVVVAPREVPPVLVTLQPGRYRRWRPSPPPPGGVAVVAPAPAPAPAPPPPPPGNVVRAKEIKAGRVTARVVYCKELHAKGGRVDRHDRVEGKQDWGGKEINVPELNADTIYAKEIHADSVDIGEAHCKEVKIGR